MKPETYEAEAGIESRHWWFVGRRELFLREILGAVAMASPRVLDAGTGTGSNLRMLAEQGFPGTIGLDSNTGAAGFCRSKGFSNVHVGSICALPYKDGVFDLVLATDVLEHVADDGLAIAELCRTLKPAGICLVTVPAFQSLWGLQDDQSMHYRRYRKKDLLPVFEQHGLDVVKSHYFNFVLFPFIWMARQAIRVFRIHIRSENELNSPLLNRVLLAVFRWDTRISAALKPPFGVSVFYLLKKRVQ